jgi:putative ABC transport system ATP-binding protein
MRTKLHVEPLLRTDGVDRAFRAGGDVFYALKGVTLSLKPGTFNLLQGPSGSGKTTLINVLGALDYPSSGSVYFDGQEISDMSEHARDLKRRTDMGFVFQSIALISLMSAYENVEFGLRITGVPASKRGSRVVECLSLVGLYKRMDHRPHELSGGEQQRVAIARAIAHRPKVVFADEPTAELDTQRGLQVVKLFRTLVEEEGITVVMSSHDPSISDLADHVYGLEDGVIRNVS